MLQKQIKKFGILLRKTKKPVILVCNKSDNFGRENNDIYEFYNLGMGDPLAVSSVNASGIGDVLDEIYKYLPEKELGEDDEDTIKVALIRKAKCTENHR